MHCRMRNGPRLCHKFSEACPSHECMWKVMLNHFPFICTGMISSRIQNPFIDFVLILQLASQNQTALRATKLSDIYKCKISNYDETFGKVSYHYQHVFFVLILVSIGKQPLILKLCVKLPIGTTLSLLCLLHKLFQTNLKVCPLSFVLVISLPL